MEPMKALVLAGGRGKRLEDVSATVNKCMLRLNGKPLVSYSFDCALRAGIRMNKAHQLWNSKPPICRARKKAPNRINTIANPNEPEVLLGLRVCRSWSLKFSLSIFTSFR